MAATERIEGLRKIPLFSDLPEQSLTRLAGAMNEVEIEPGHVLVHRGMPGTGLFVIEEGEVVVDLTSRQVELGPGEFVGELALLTDSAHTGRAMAKTRVKAVAIGRDEFSDLLHSEPSMALVMLSTLARRLAAAP
jgi:CRP/FNR family cyclic AMP-dependent transcriptional regulator